MRINMYSITLGMLASLLLSTYVASFTAEPSIRSSDVFHPHRISYHTLLNDDAFTAVSESFVHALAHVGMISITGLFSESRVKNDTFAWLHDCAQSNNGIVKTHEYQDGTVRRTLPTHSIHNVIQQFPFNSNSDTSDSCKEFSESSYQFRKMVDEATSVFAKRLTQGDNDKPLLVTESGSSFDSVSEIVESGEHLEHFHSYQKNKNGNVSLKDETIEWHVDQGLFLVFTPGRKVQLHNKFDEAELTEGFYIQQEDGSQTLVEFAEDDDLVIMLGDGVNQYVTPKNREGHAASLRAVPHSLLMPHMEEDEARVWYGRMVLPPSEALHPDHGVTFGELRKRMIHGAIHHGADDEALVLGCSSQLVARDLQESINCTSDELYCWHACMPLAEFNVSSEICESRDMVLNCTNMMGDLWNGNHGDFYPGCVQADAKVATTYPTLPNYPRDSATCTDTVFVEYAASNSEGFAYQFELPYRGNGMSAKLLWSIVDNQVHGKIVFNGLFGWLAFGFANPEGAKNGMHGGHVLMALPGGNYSDITGLDMALDPTIDEYLIAEDASQSSFRFWKDPISAMMRTLSGSTLIDFNDCNTALSFNSSSIGGIAFNLSGEDDLMWAANSVDYFAGYHGDTRGRFYINWALGTGRNWEAPVVTAPTAPTPVMPPTTVVPTAPVVVTAVPSVAPGVLSVAPQAAPVIPFDVVPTPSASSARYIALKTLIIAVAAASVFNL